MNRRTKTAIGAGLAGASIFAVVGGVALAGAADDDANEVPITGANLETASSVALEYLGEGRVTGTEEGDEDSYYEVEVTLDNGREVDVQLDREFNVVSAEQESQSGEG